MKKTLILFAGLLLGSGLFAQRGYADRTGSPEDRADRAARHLAVDLDLTDTQVPQVKACFENFFKARDAAFEAAGDARPGPETMKPILETHRAALSDILTPDQAARMQELKEGRQARKQQMEKDRGEWKGRGKGNGAPHGPRPEKP